MTTSRVLSVTGATTRPRSTSTAASRARAEAACGSQTTLSGMASGYPLRIARLLTTSVYRFQCYRENYSSVQQCSCTKYKVYHTVYVNDTAPAQVTYLSGTFTKEERPGMSRGLLAPLYVDQAGLNILLKRLEKKMGGNETLSQLFSALMLIAHY